MEENSDAHMETDVSSTTEDVPEVPLVTGSHGEMETVIVVEQLKEEESNSLFFESKISSPSTSISTSPQKPGTPQKVTKILIDESEVAKKLFIINLSESPNIGSRSPISTITSPVKHLPEYSDSLKKVETAVSPGQSENPIEKSPVKISLAQNAVQKSPAIGVKVKPIKLIRIRENNDANALDAPSKEVQKIPDIENTLLKISNQEVEVPEKSASIVVIQENINKQDTENLENIKEKSLKEVQEKSPVKELQTQTDGMELNLENTNKEVSKRQSPSKDDGIHNSPKKVTSNGVLMVNTFNIDKPSSSDTDIPEKRTKILEVNEKADIAPVQTEELSTTNLNGSQSSMEVEKEHNKSINRELKSLINSAKESKIISECNQLKSKMRKSRSQMDSMNTSLNASMEADKIGIRRGSNNSQVSNSSEKSDKGKKRSMRSQNPEFVTKCRLFLNTVNAKTAKDSDQENRSEHEAAKSDEKLARSKSSPPSQKKKKIFDRPVLDENRSKFRADGYCWRCHWTVETEENDKSNIPLLCTVCPRSFHYKCLSVVERKTAMEKNYVCADCSQILQAEGSDTRSQAMKKTSLGMLSDLLKYALERMMDLNGVEPFLHPVDLNAFPDYEKYVVHPMDLTQMMQNITNNLYGSTEAFVADVQWILHNSIIFNTLQSKLTAGARALVRSCRAEMGEIEACPECYAGAHARRATWFTDVCTTPHILLWAKLKGFPYWPAKGMSVNSSGLVDVRFFGAHDRAWVPAKDCFLFSEKDPNNFRSKRQDILDSIQEAEQHIKNISRKYGKFVYPPFKTQLDPTKINAQLKMMIPLFEGEIRTLLKDKPAAASPLAKMKRRSISKGSKSSTCDGDGSESEDVSTSARTEAIKTKKTETNDKDIAIEKLAKSDVVVTKVQAQALEQPIVTRKRRRSNLEEALIITVMEPSQPVPEKKNRTDKPEQQEPSSSKEDKSLSTSKEDAESASRNKTDAARSKSKDEEPSSSTHDEKESEKRVTPIKLVALPRPNKQTPKMFAATKASSNPTSPRLEDKTSQKNKSAKQASASEKSKEDKPRKQRNSRSNKSLNGTTILKTNENIATPGKELHQKESKKKETSTEANKSVNETQSKSTDSTRSLKERITFDDDSSLAVIVRERRRSYANLPTISSVCSLSTVAQASLTSTSTTSSTSDITIEASSDSRIFTPTSTETVQNMKEAVMKLQKLRDNTEPVVGRVGVCAFARMTSPGRVSAQNQLDNMEVEIKAEPMDTEEDEVRLNEKMDLMTACKLQPVNQNLRDVRINRVVAGPSPGTKKAEPRPRAKKTFPQPRPSDVRSELDGKNSMVYIPIQPPATQAPLRPVRPTAQTVRISVPASANSTANNTVNTVISSIKPTSASVVNVHSAGQVSVPTVGPTTVHTVPLMTSVNGQWMFSLQPVMSVGGLDNASASPMVNGVTTQTLVPLSTSSTSTPAAASAQTNRSTSESSATAEFLRVQQRLALIHPLAASAPGPVPTPPAAGPITAKLHQNAQKLTDFFRTLIEDTIEKVDDPAATATALKQQLEQVRWRHSLVLEELKHNHEIVLAEMRLSFEKDKLRAANEARIAMQAEVEAAVKVAKSKQWCTHCSQEAQFYCCWNTAYCTLACQRANWPTHFTHCAQRPREGNGYESGNESRAQILPDVLPTLQKSGPTPTQGPVAAPVLTVGGKLTTRVFSQQDASAPKTSIIMSMVEDTSGNQTMKCVGTYKPNTPQGQMPLVLNKQVISDEPAKKVVTSGGYLIVGAGNNASIITPSQTRRPNSIQYFT